MHACTERFGPCSIFLLSSKLFWSSRGDPGHFLPQESFDRWVEAQGQHQNSRGAADLGAMPPGGKVAMTYPDHPPKYQPNRSTDSWAIDQSRWHTRTHTCSVIVLVDYIPNRQKLRLHVAPALDIAWSQTASHGYCFPHSQTTRSYTYVEKLAYTYPYFKHCKIRTGNCMNQSGGVRC